MHTVTFRLTKANSTQTAQIGIRDLILAGWTGRDRAALQKHIDELAALGIKPPASVPVFYRTSAARVTTAGEIEVCGGDSSGEVEFVLVRSNGAMWVGAGSDHTDRKVESYGITVAKQMYDKVMPNELWAFEEIAGHWERLILRSWAINGGKAELYQEAEVSTMLTPAELIAGYTGGGELGDDTVLFSGTVAAKGGIRPAERFRFELEDPVRGRALRHEYGVRVLPVNG